MSVRVRYATAADGWRIAFTVTGAGPAILYMPPLPLRHVELERQSPKELRWLERLERAHTVIGYDPRGLGLSQRGVERYSLEALVDDVAAVVEAAGVGPVSILACLNAAPIAIAYAVREPQTVAHVVLWCASARMADTLPPPIATLAQVMDRDWELVTDAAARVLVGWDAGEDAGRYADFLRASVARDEAHALLEGLRSVTVEHLLSSVRTPTLVLHRRALTWIPLERAQELASHIPDARLQVLDGDLMRLGVGDVEPVARAIEEFIGSATPERDADHDAAAERPERPQRPRNRFVREGEYWTLEFQGTLCHLRDAKGLRHIARLLGDPGRSVPAAMLVSWDDGGEGEGGPIGGDAGPLLDAKAKAAYEARLRELREDLAEAEGSNDAGRIRASIAEIEVLSHQLSAAVGLGGRDRRAASAAERARLTVTKRIKAALANIRAQNPALGDHLARAIRTGHLCAYDPGQAVVDWEL